MIAASERAGAGRRLFRFGGAMNALLQDVVVLDFSEYIAGPYCGSLLADMGARVIKIEPPDGAEERRMGNRKRYRGNTRLSLAFNRGKESLSVDLRQEQGRQIVYDLARTADVIVQNFAPGVASKLGVDYDALSKHNPQLIFLSSTAFGEVGPYSRRKGFDIIAHAASGVMSNYADEQGAPRGPGGIPYIDIGTGMLGALAIVSALYHRSRTGQGQKVETSLFATGVALQATQMIQVETLDAQRHAEEVQALKTAYDEGKNHTQIIDRFAEMRLRDDLPDSKRPIEVPDCLHRPTDRQTYPYYRIYRTGDGYLGIAALNKGLRDKVCDLLGIHDPYTDQNSADFSDAVYAQQKELMREIEQRLETQPSDYWVSRLEAAGVPCGRVNYHADMYADPQARSLELIWNLSNRELGNYQAAGAPMRFSKTPVRAGKGAPVLGEHSESVMRGLAYDDAQIAGLKARGVVK